MRRLQNPIRPYAWGSREIIAQVQGRPVPSAGPEAELWIGAHPDSPSTIDGRSLAEAIASAPGELLGADAHTAYGARLPYLMKLLAAERSLSLQAHPDARQAADGFAAEERAGVPRTAPHRSYVDGNHKPELLVAYTPFEALCGFRAPAASAELVDALSVTGLKRVVGALAAGDLREAVQTLLSWPAADRADLLEQVTANAGKLPSGEVGGGPRGLVRRLAQEYPGDVGVVVSLLLNHLLLEPGQGIWMPAGNLHGYLRGAGIEIMAASDNVLRGGLTPKHVNVPELLRVLRFEPLHEPVRDPEPVAPGVVTWSVPVPDFRLHRVRLDDEVGEARVALDGPRTVFCAAGTVTVGDESGSVTLRGGEAAYGLPAGGSLTFSGAGEAYTGSL
ncbi:putative mannose-6-phosphate isomerase ManA [Catellatospora sp. TT07R-123]|uniref:mannose-6-phosphate isomerase, class I n=1 Tax=Catellatospora sp. TT07R-123 TaxID=2733863 RepID=UPI001B0A0CE7|nr:mannose-6-phosphate isomerase, class I [Catellatospora sp. TT07R-123]GHJ45775.1 putative mannose-6-phosphate isomerase ManA [Catellatospora sp. TT07R-123]